MNQIWISDLLVEDRLENQDVVVIFHHRHHYHHHFIVIVILFAL